MGASAAIRIAIMVVCGLACRVVQDRQHVCTLDLVPCKLLVSVTLCTGRHVLRCRGIRRGRHPEGMPKDEANDVRIPSRCVFSHVARHVQPSSFFASHHHRCHAAAAQHRSHHIRRRQVLSPRPSACRHRYTPGMAVCLRCLCTRTALHSSLLLSSRVGAEAPFLPCLLRRVPGHDRFRHLRYSDVRRTSALALHAIPPHTPPSCMAVSHPLSPTSYPTTSLALMAAAPPCMAQSLGTAPRIQRVCRVGTPPSFSLQVLVFVEWLRELGISVAFRACCSCSVLTCTWPPLHRQEDLEPDCG